MGKLRTVDVDIVGDAYQEVDFLDTYPFEKKYPTIGLYCYSKDAIEIIEKLQARIVELEGVVGELEMDEKIKAHEQRMAEERQMLSQASDAEKLTAYLNAVIDIEVPTVQSAAAKGILRMLKDCIQAAVSKVERMTD